MSKVERLMTHVVAGFPSFDKCLELILGMDKLGVTRLEVQVPFSDPIADGETIMEANDVALNLGMNTEKSFKLIKQAKNRGVKAEIYVMSYLQKLINFGIEDFCSEAKRAGASGLIIPDLPFDSLEYSQLQLAAERNALKFIPVISPGMSQARLKKLLFGDRELVYLTSSKGITGNRLLVSSALGQLARSVKEINPNCLVAIGFGLQTKKDISQILKIADVAVIGSAVIREVQHSNIEGGLAFLSKLTD